MPSELVRDQAARLRRALQQQYPAVRAMTQRLMAPLAAEDTVVQSMPDVSPTRWHLAHTTWFFETFVLAPARPEMAPFDPAFAHLFNSYYETVGDPFPRTRRGLLSRPTLERVLAYRDAVDARMQELLADDALDDLPHVTQAIELGLHHEQQHQELILTDIKHVLSCNPLWPAYRDEPLALASATPVLDWVAFDAGVHEIGHDGRGFAFDNELPRHGVLVPPFALATRLASNAEYQEFVDDRGYQRPELWLADGWAKVRQHGWEAPLYWVRRDGAWDEFTLRGLRPLEPAAPVSHVSYYEADAFARWAQARLPTEFEWEVASSGVPLRGNFLESDVLHPRAAPPSGNGVPAQMFGDVWEWTASSYAPYPGYRPLAGSLGEYNGKFMCSQYVLRGGSCATPQSHVRRTYRNFFYPDARWQFSGIRLAR